MAAGVALRQHRPVSTEPDPAAGDPVSFLVPCRPHADLARLEAVLRRCGVNAAVELPFEDAAEVELVLVAVVPGEEHPEERPADLLAIRSPRPGFTWELLTADALAAALTEEFGGPILADRFLWTGRGWVDEDDADPEELAAFERAAELFDGDRGSRIATTGSFDPMLLSVMARNAPRLRSIVDDDGRATVWPADASQPYTLLDGLPAVEGAVTFETTRYERVLMVADRREVHLRRWPAGSLVVDPANGFAPAEDRDVRFTEALTDVDPNGAVKALGLDDERASLFRALWRDQRSDATTFSRFSELLDLPPLAADLVEERAQAPAGAATAQPRSLFGAMRHELSTQVPLPGWLGAWQRFSARHPLLRWVITSLGIALPGALIALHHTGVRESPVVVVAYVAVALWMVDALTPRKAID